MFPRSNAESLVDSFSFQDRRREYGVMDAPAAEDSSPGMPPMAPELTGMMGMAWLLPEVLRLWRSSGEPDPETLRGPILKLVTGRGFLATDGSCPTGMDPVAQADRLVDQLVALLPRVKRA